MSYEQLCVEDFHRKFGSTVGDTPEIRDRELRAKLIMEEAVETVAALGFAAYGGFSEPYGEDDPQPDPIFQTFKHYAEPDFVEVIDGLCDLIYVTLGAAVTFGVHLDPFFNEVHRSNMAKEGGTTRADGKVLKPAGWTAPDIAGILQRQKERAA